MSLIRTLGGIAVPAAGPGPGIDYGFNFRSTEGYVVDLNNENWVRDSVHQYEYNFDNGATGGYNDTYNRADRDDQRDRRLAGIVFNRPSNLAWFRVNLPADDYDLTIAAGDANFQNFAVYASITNGTTQLYSVEGMSHAAGTWLDAESFETGAAAKNEAAWLAGADGGVRLRVTIDAGYMLYRHYTDAQQTGSDNSPICHLRIQSV